MRRILILLVSRFPSLFLGCRTIENRLESAATPQDLLQATADFYVKDAHDAACAVALVTTNETLFATAGECTTNSLFRIASLSKLFLNYAIENALTNSAINLKATVGDYLPLPEEYRPLTLGELRNNQSGLPRDFIDVRNPFEVWQAFASGFYGAHLYEGFDSLESFQSICQKFYWRHTLSENRAKVPRPHIYSNVGYGLLGLCLEKQTGLSLENFIAQYLSHPLGLEDTTYEPERTGRDSRLTRACAGHLPWLIRRGNNVPDIRLGKPLRAAGGLFASIIDCVRVFEGYWHLVDAECAKTPHEELTDGNLIELLRVKRLSSGKSVLYRAGMIYGGASFACFDPETRSIVVILRNVTSWPDKRGFKLVEALREAEGTK